MNQLVIVGSSREGLGRQEADQLPVDGKEWTAAEEIRLQRVLVFNGAVEPNDSCAIL
jgi:hypothetical protein